MLYRLFLILLPVFLHASWTDWFFGTQQPQAKEFKCPHHCGEWGSESIQKVEWQGVLVLYELDKMNHDYNKFPFPYSSPPRSKEDPWYKEILHSRAVEIKPYVNYNSISTCYRFHYLENSEKVFRCCCKSSYYSNGHCWELFNSRTTDGKIAGKVGIEFALFKGTQKGVKVYRDLRKANAALTLNRMSTSVQAEQLITAYQREWIKSSTKPFAINISQSIKSAKSSTKPALKPTLAPKASPKIGKQLFQKREVE